MTINQAFEEYGKRYMAGEISWETYNELIRRHLLSAPTNEVIVYRVMALQEVVLAAYDLGDELAAVLYHPDASVMLQNMIDEFGWRQLEGVRQLKAAKETPNAPT